MKFQYIKIAKNSFYVFYYGKLLLLMLIAIFSWRQYRFFSQEIYDLQLIKESYLQHIDMLNRSVCASQQDTDSLDTSSDEPEELVIESDEMSPENNNKVPSSFFIQNSEHNELIIKDNNVFELISPEEESRLEMIKKRSSKSQINLMLGKKRKKRFKMGYKKNRAHHYVPDCDFNFSWPIELSKFWLSSLYGPRRLSNRKLAFHHGIDMAGVRGTLVKAAASGKVTNACFISGYGNCIDVMHDKHYKTRYAHLNTIKVRSGQEVVVGQIIGTVGSTGFVRKSGTDASHLHFEIHHNGHTVNPLRYLFL
ncbi:M23 family metallopeptidase [Candidatus Dependentiae bacterium]|nr:M23 family metallopeptidase [Candidatus Dependentiae bacterium]